ncbi:MAG: hypothetical protein EBZ48_00230 [Proteobacteria bacterium]|nr:hypothetical protein [Pseudomonadota bacterium]
MPEPSRPHDNFPEQQRAASQDDPVTITGTDHAWLRATTLIKDGKIAEVLSTLHNYPGELHNKIALELIAAGHSDAVASQLVQFQNCNDAAALNLIEQGYAAAVLANLKSFRDLTQTIFDKLTSTAHRQVDLVTLAEGLASFRELASSAALLLVEHGQVALVVRYREYFGDFNFATLQKVTQLGALKPNTVSAISDRLRAEDLPRLAEFFIDSKQYGGLASILHRCPKFDYLSEATAQIVTDGLLAHSRRLAAAYLSNLDRFPQIEPYRLLFDLLSWRREGLLAEHRAAFASLDFNKQLLLRLVKDGLLIDRGSIVSLFHGLDQEVADLLIASFHGGEVVESLSSFNPKDYREIARLILRHNNGDLLAQHFASFTEVTVTDLVDLVTEELKNGPLPKLRPVLQLLPRAEGQVLIARIKAQGDYVSIAECLDLCEGINHTEVARELVRSDHLSVLHQQAPAFNDLDPQFAFELINNGLRETTCRLLSGLKEIDHSQVAKALLNCPDTLDSKTVLNLIIGGRFAPATMDWSTILTRLRDLDHTVATALIGRGYCREVAHHLPSFKNFDIQAALALCAAGYIYPVLKNLQLCIAPEHIQSSSGARLSSHLALELIRRGQSARVANNLSALTEVNCEVAHHLIKNGHAAAVSRNIDRFKELDAAVAVALIEAGFASEVVLNLDRFTQLSENNALALIDVGWREVVTYHRDRFTSLGEYQPAPLKGDAQTLPTLAGASTIAGTPVDKGLFETIREGSISKALSTSPQVQALLERASAQVGMAVWSKESSPNSGSYDPFLPVFWYDPHSPLTNKDIQLCIHDATHFCLGALLPVRLVNDVTIATDSHGRTDFTISNSSWRKTLLDWESTCYRLSDVDLPLALGISGAKELVGEASWWEFFRRNRTPHKEQLLFLRGGARGSRVDFHALNQAFGADGFDHQERREKERHANLFSQHI